MENLKTYKLLFFAGIANILIFSYQSFNFYFYAGDTTRSILHLLVAIGFICVCIYSAKKMKSVNQSNSERAD